MPNVLQNVFKTSGLNGQQPWQQYYQGIKPKNPLGGNIVRRMGNKVKGVVPATNTKIMQFSYMTGTVQFKADSNYIPPYKPLPGDNPQYYTVNQTSPPYYYSDPNMANPYSSVPAPMQGQDGQMPMLSPREQLRLQREAQRSAREQRREARRAVADTRANYRTLLDTTREVRNWSGGLGVL